LNLDDLDAPRRGALLAGARRTTFVRGDFVFTPGDRADCVYVVDCGRIKIVLTTPGGAESIVAIRNPGDLFAELAWATGRTARASSAIALDQSDVYRIDNDSFERSLRADATLCSHFARGLARRLAGVERELTELAGKSVPGRLVDVLGRLAADHGVREDDGTVRIALSLTHKDLADIIGTTRETLTKELGVLADVGLVRVAHRTIVLLQPRAFPFALRRA